MNSQLTPQMTIRVNATGGTAGDALEITEHAAFATVRRAVIRLRAAHVASGLLHEMTAGCQVTAPRKPLFVRLDALQERYTALGGDPGDLVR
jgi:hypothetical protein